MNRLADILKTPVNEVDLSCRLLLYCKKIGITDVCQLVKLYFDNDDRLFSICGNTLSEIEQLMEENSITQKDYPLISELFRVPFPISPVRFLKIAKEDAKVIKLPLPE